MHRHEGGPLSLRYTQRKFSSMHFYRNQWKLKFLMSDKYLRRNLEECIKITAGIQSAKYSMSLILCWILPQGFFILLFGTIIDHKVIWICFTHCKWSPCSWREQEIEAALIREHSPEELSLWAGSRHQLWAGKETTILFHVLFFIKSIGGYVWT